MLALALLAVLAAAPEPAPAPAAEAPDSPLPFAGCRATPSGNGWTYECPGFQVTAVDDALRLSPSMVTGFKIGVRSSVSAAEDAFDRPELALGGASAEVFRYLGDTGVAWIVLVSRPEGMRRLVCVEPLTAEGKCRRALEALVPAGWQARAAPGAVELEEPVLTLGGKPVAVPAGCTAESRPGGAVIACDGMKQVVTWVTVPSEALVRKAVDQMRDGLLRNLRKASVTLTTTHVPCRATGTAATCEDVRISSQAGGAGGGLIRFTTVPQDGGTVMLYFCVAPDGVPPRACALVFGGM